MKVKLHRYEKDRSQILGNCQHAEAALNLAPESITLRHEILKNNYEKLLDNPVRVYILINTKLGTSYHPTTIHITNAYFRFDNNQEDSI
jgi:hypothetical protein